MTLRYLLDTNVISEPLRPEPHPQVLARLQQHQEAIAIASMVWHELIYGAARLPPSARRTAIERYLHQVIAPTLPVLPWRCGGGWRRRASASGRASPASAAGGPTAS